MNAISPVFDFGCKQPIFIIQPCIPLEVDTKLRLMAEIILVPSMICCNNNNYPLSHLLGLETRLRFVILLVNCNPRLTGEYDHYFRNKGSNSHNMCTGQRPWKASVGVPSLMLYIRVQISRCITSVAPRLFSCINGC